MSSPAPLAHTTRNSIAHLKSVQKFNGLEAQWVATLRKTAAQTRLTPDALVSCEASYISLLTYLRSLQFLRRTRNTDFDQLLEVYRTEAAAINKNIRSWLVLYLDLAGSWEDLGTRSNRKTKKVTPAAIKPEAASCWTRLKSAEPISPRIKDMLTVRDVRDTYEKDSPEWRRSNRRLLHLSHDLMLDNINEACLGIHKLFERVVYRESARNLFNTEEAPEDKNKTASSPSYNRHMFIQRVEDWIRGYHPPSSREQTLDGQVFDRLHKKLKTSYIRRVARQTLLALAVVVTIGSVIVAFKTSRLDNQIWDTVSTQVKKLLSLDPVSVRLRERRQFFADQILTIKDNYSEASILRNLRTFADMPSSTEQEKAMYFAEHILKGYFLLLTDWETTDAFKEKILKGAHAYDADIHHHMHSLTRMFSSDKMTESHFQIHTLMLRKAFVQKGVFPFLFLSLYKDHPYVFLYPERIINEYHFEAEQLKAIGLNVAYYSHAANIPLTAHIIEGKTYPFKDRAGYFEGQYAIVFNHIAGNAKWTALHEFGHSIDQMRFLFGEVAYPLNVESHSMLFPVMFAKDPGRYVQNKLLASVAVADPLDLYVQASKGILNGFIQHQKKRNPGLTLPLINDDFDKQTIAEVRQWIGGYSDEQLRAISRELYQDSATYMSTAKGGTYRGHFHNAEEIVAGAHGPPTQSFLVDEFGEGDFSSGNSTRFIRDVGQQAAKPKDLWSFIKAVIYITLHPAVATDRRDSAEAVASSILIFILVESLLMLIQWLGSPLRKRRFNGILPKDIINDIYEGNPWSDGKSAGEEKGERRLLEECFHPKPALLDKQLMAEIANFKASVDTKRKVLFDVCLTLAPWISKQAAVKSRWHNLLFWLPFLGPLLGRWSWLMPRQKPFHQREAFNTQIKNLCMSIQPDTSLDEFLERHKQILVAYQSAPVRKTVEYREDIQFLEALEKHVHARIDDAEARVTLRQPMIKRRAIQNYHEDVDFDRLDKYIYGDDVKRIDWRATARTVNNEPVVRKSAAVYGLNVGFLMDFRDMHEHARRDQFALDFMKSLRMLGKDRQLQQLIFVMPNGEIFSQRIRLKLPVTPHARAQQLWDKVAYFFQENLKHRMQLNIPGLLFYTEEENELYRERYKLTDFPYKSTEGIAFEKLDVHYLNVFLIGMNPELRHEVPDYLPATNQVFFW